MLTEKLFNLAQGGAEIILYILLLLSVISIGLILERLVTLGAVKRNSDRVKARIKEALQSNNYAEIEEIARDRDSLEGRALAYGLRHAKEKGVSGLEEVFSAYALVERPALERSLNFLATVGSNAPFIGLLGTVLGIMKAFRDLSNNVGAGNEAVMLGIAEALVATAVGLIVAIPAVIAYNHFQRQVRGSMHSLESVRELCLAYAKGKA